MYNDLEHFLDGPLYKWFCIKNNNNNNNIGNANKCMLSFRESIVRYRNVFVGHKDNKSLVN